MPHPDGITQNEKIIIILAGMMDVQRRALVYNDIEAAREEFEQLNNLFNKYFLINNEARTPQAFPVEDAVESDRDIPW